MTKAIPRIAFFVSAVSDVAAYTLTDTPARRQLVDFTVPLMQARHKLVTGINGPDISDRKKLRNVEPIAQPGSTYVDTAKRLVAESPQLKLTILEAAVYENRETLVELLNEKPNRAAIFDDVIVDNMAKYRDDVRVGASVSERENIAWAVRKDSTQLLATVNNFLTRNLVKAPDDRIEDWKAIKQSGVIRFTTYNRTNASPSGFPRRLFREKIFRAVSRRSS